LGDGWPSQILLLIERKRSRLASQMLANVADMPGTVPRAQRSLAGRNGPLRHRLVASQHRESVDLGNAERFREIGCA
jgi:hypothetical protein